MSAFPFWSETAKAIYPQWAAAHAASRSTVEAQFHVLKIAHLQLVRECRPGEIAAWLAGFVFCTLALFALRVWLGETVKQSPRRNMGQKI